LRDVGIGVGPSFEELGFFQQFFRGFGVVPETRNGRQLFIFGNGLQLGLDVKDISLGRRPSLPAPCIVLAS
jgi:hypothetical protein